MHHCCDLMYVHFLPAAYRLDSEDLYSLSSHSFYLTSEYLQYWAMYILSMTSTSTTVAYYTLSAHPPVSLCSVTVTEEARKKGRCFLYNSHVKPWVRYIAEYYQKRRGSIAGWHRHFYMKRIMWIERQIYSDRRGKMELKKSNGAKDKVFTVVPESIDKSMQNKMKGPYWQWTIPAVRLLVLLQATWGREYSPRKS